MMITTHFAPDIHVGAKRMTKFAKYLPLYDWQPVVLTKEVSEYHGVDETLLEELPPDLPIYRVREWRFPGTPISPAQTTPGEAIQGKQALVGVCHHLIKAVKFFLFYDYSWLLPAFLIARRLVRENDIPVIYSSSPNPESHMVALLLRLTMPVKWVCEFRDPWTTDHPYYPNISTIQRKSDKYLERLFLHCSDHIVSVGQMLKEDLIRLAGTLRQDKVSVIFNGYDKEDFTGSVASIPKDNRCVITHTGTWGPGRSPEDFLKALTNLLSNYPAMRTSLRVNFIGEFKFSPDLEKTVRQYIEQANLSDIVSIISWLPYKEALANLLASDILLLIERPESPTSNNFWVVTSKVFLYLYARRPILALIPSGSEVARIIREADAGEIVYPTDVEAIKKKIHEMYRLFQRGQLRISPNMAEVEKYDRRKQTATLAQIFDALTDSA